MKKIRNIVMFLAMIMILSGVNVYAATVGDGLETPEASWQRYDDTNSKIVYLGDWKTEVLDKNYYGSAKFITPSSAKILTFRFKGTKLRIISGCYTGRTQDTSVIIDGVKHTTIQENAPSTGIQIIVAEVKNLDNKEHIVELKCNDGKVVMLDAIDIDESGQLISYDAPNSPLNLVSTVSANNISLSWDPVSDADSYTILRSTTSGAIDTVLVSGLTDNTYLDTTSIDPGVTYYYVVRAVKAGKESADSNITSSTVKVTDKKLKLILEKNQEKQLSITDDLIDNAKVKWSSSDETIATVDANGKVIALEPGDTVITCENEDGSYTETINVLVVDLDLQLAVDLNIGEKCRLTVDDLMNTVKITWKADDSTIATVSAKGKVTAINEGLTYITAIDKTGKELGRIYIRVRE